MLPVMGFPQISLASTYH